ncbi:hypothetical protein ACOMHN_046570 [Nucella lapillus]
MTTIVTSTSSQYVLRHQHHRPSCTDSYDGTHPHPAHHHQHEHHDLSRKIAGTPMGMGTGMGTDMGTDMGTGRITGSPAPKVPGALHKVRTGRDIVTTIVVLTSLMDLPYHLGNPSLVEIGCSLMDLPYHLGNPSLVEIGCSLMDLPYHLGNPSLVEIGCSLMDPAAWFSPGTVQGWTKSKGKNINSFSLKRVR